MRVFHLNESINELSSDELKLLLRTDFSVAHKLAMNGYYACRGMDEVFGGHACYYKKLEDRVSRNTKNYYTLWINSHPSWSKYPKRNVIASTDRSYAGGYGLDLYVILPKNGSKVGVCPDEDMWSSFSTSINVGDTSIDMIMEFFGDVFRREFNRDPKTYDELVKCLNALNPNDIETMKSDEIFFEYYSINLNLRHYIMKNGFYDAFENIFTPKDFIATDIHAIERFSAESREIWFDSDFIAVNYDDRKKILNIDLGNDIISENENYSNWTLPSNDTMKLDFKEYKLKEYTKWEERASTIGARFPLFNNFNDYKNSIRNAKEIIVTDDLWSKVENLSSNESIEDIEDMVSGYIMPRDVARIQDGFENDSKIPYPVILKGKNGLFIMSGNTRLNVASVMGISPKALLVDISEQ